MHPTVMSMIADDRAKDLRAHRRGRVIRGDSRRFFAFRLARRGARIAQA